MDYSKLSFPQEWQKYVDSLSDTTDILSGDPDYLIGSAHEAYCKFESLSEQYHIESTCYHEWEVEIEITIQKTVDAYKIWEAEMLKIFNKE